MKGKKITGIVIVLVGVVMVLFSMYIKYQVAQGKLAVSAAQESVDRVKSGGGIFSLNPVTKGIEKEVTNSVQEKINAGELEIAKYANMALYLQIGGIICIVLGGALLFVNRKLK